MNIKESVKKISIIYITKTCIQREWRYKGPVYDSRWNIIQTHFQINRFTEM